jgi:hypothetical protein
MVLVSNNGEVVVGWRRKKNKKNKSKREKEKKLHYLKSRLPNKKRRKVDDVAQSERV